MSKMIASGAGAPCCAPVTLLRACLIRPSRSTVPAVGALRREEVAGERDRARGVERCAEPGVIRDREVVGVLSLLIDPLPAFIGGTRSWYGARAEDSQCETQRHHRCVFRQHVI